jgi:polyhydroxyalkanoate synthesis repressor PhaR
VIVYVTQSRWLARRHADVISVPGWEEILPEDDRPTPPVVVKKYANRRLYDTESSIYITLDTLADMVRRGRDFVVYDAKTGDDITRSVLTQIIMEEETRGRNMLPTAFLRRLIGLYGDSLQGLVPEYLERVMEQFAAQQQVRTSMQRTMQTFLPPELEEVGRQNPAPMSRAMNLFSPFYKPGQDNERAAAETADESAHEQSHAAPVRSAQDEEEIIALHEEIARLRAELAHATAGLAEPVGVLRTAGGSVRH